MSVGFLLLAPSTAGWAQEMFGGNWDEALQEVRLQARAGAAAIKQCDYEKWGEAKQAYERKLPLVTANLDRESPAFVKRIKDNIAPFPLYPFPCQTETAPPAPQRATRQPAGGGRFGPRPSIVSNRDGPRQGSGSPAATPAVQLASWSPLSPMLIELVGWGGAASASSFGADYNTDFWGGRAAARLPVGQFRVQGDIQGERSADYAPAVGNRAYVAGGLHLDYAISPRTEIGAFGGSQDAKPTFHGPESTNYFAGLEGRYSIGPALFGAQFGRLDVSTGPGTLTGAWFVEGRVRLSIGEVFKAPLLNYTTIGGELGYGSGTLSGRNVGAQTTYWGARLMQAFADKPVSVFVAYEHFENRVDGLGLVWNEDMVKGGIKVVFSGSTIGLQPKEPTQPLPFLLRTVTNF